MKHESYGQLYILLLLKHARYIYLGDNTPMTNYLIDAALAFALTLVCASIGLLLAWRG